MSLLTSPRGYVVAAFKHLQPFRLAVSLTLACGLAACGANSETPPPTSAITTIAAGGRVEPEGEERVVIPELSGRLKKVHIQEGDTVRAGQLLAEIENADLAAQIEAARAQLQLRQAMLDRLNNGARPEEVREAEALLAETAAAEALAEQEFRRIAALSADKQLSRSALDNARSNQASAAARHSAQSERLQLLRLGARTEDKRIAEAELAGARAELARAEALYAKSQIRSPIAGVVLKRELREGETVVSLSPVPLARIGSMTRLTVRADIDELDIHRIKLGQKAEIRSDALPGQVFTGSVSRVSQRMGKRAAPSENPAEKVDVKVLEALITLDGQPPLPIGLRVDVLIQTAKKS